MASSQNIKRSAAFVAPFAITLGLIAVMTPMAQAGPLPLGMAAIDAIKRGFWGDLWHDALKLGYWFFHKTSSTEEHNIIPACVNGALDVIFGEFQAAIPCGIALGVTVVNGVIAALLKYELDHPGKSSRDDEPYSAVGNSVYWYEHQDLEYLHQNFDEILGDLAKNVVYSAVVTDSTDHDSSKSKRDNHDDVLYFWTLDHQNTKVSVSTTGDGVPAALKEFVSYSQGSTPSKRDDDSKEYASYVNDFFNPDNAAAYLQTVNTTNPGIINSTENSIWGRKEGNNYWLVHKACIGLGKSETLDSNSIIAGELYFDSYGDLDKECAL